MIFGHSCDQFNRDMNKTPTHFRVPPEFQTLLGTISTVRCLTHIRDAAHSECNNSIWTHPHKGKRKRSRHNIRWVCNINSARCNNLHHTERTAAHCKPATLWNTQQHTATQYNTLQYTATVECVKKSFVCGNYAQFMLSCTHSFFRSVVLACPMCMYTHSGTYIYVWTLITYVWTLNMKICVFIYVYTCACVCLSLLLTVSSMKEPPLSTRILKK